MRLRRPEPDVGDARRARQAQRPAAAARRARRASCASYRRGRPDRRAASRPCAPAEAQAAAIADDIAYISHDLDDGLRAGLIVLDDLVDVPLAGRFRAREAAGAGVETQRASSTRSTGASITPMIDDVVREPASRLAALALRKASRHVRGAGRAGDRVVAERRAE